MYKDKILAALRVKYKDLGLGDAVLTAMAENLAAQVKEESEIDNIVNGVGSILKGFQSDSDKRVTDAVLKAKQSKQEPGGNPDPNKVEPEKTPATEIPEWAKELVTSNKALQGEISALKTEKSANGRKQSLTEKLAAFNPKFTSKILKDFDRMQFADDQEFESYLNDTIVDLTAVDKDLVEQTLGATPRPTFQKGKNGDTKEASTEELDAVMRNLNI